MNRKLEVFIEFIIEVVGEIVFELI